MHFGSPLPSARIAIRPIAASRKGFLRGSAFTLVELLAVIAIISVLALISLNVIGKVRDSSRTTQCASHLRELGQATLLYAQDHQNVYPPTYGTVKNGVPITNTAWWWELFPAYCNSSEVFSCPLDNTGFSGTYTPTWTYKGQTFPEGKVSYGALGHVSGGSDFKPLGKPIPLFSAPTRTVLYIDYQSADARLSKTWQSNNPRWLNASSKSPENNSYPAFPHNGGTKANMVFLDGHIGLMSQPEMVAAVNTGSLFVGAVAPQ
jgi:general secretion pathway protein G